MKESYGTLSQTINGLKEDGYDLDFNVHEERLVCSYTKTSLTPDEFEIDKIYRFEGMTNPEDQAILYAISSPKFGVKGVLVNGYGPTSDEMADAIIKKLHTHPEQQK